MDRCAELQPGHELARRARAPRAPHARQAARRLRRRRRHLSRDGRLGRGARGRAPGARRRRRRRRRAALVQQHRVPGDDLRRRTTSARSRCRSTGGSRRAELRFILEHSEARALVCDDALVDLANEATNDLADDLVRVVHRDREPRGVGALRRPRRRVAASRPRARPRRRHPPADVHVGNHRAAEGRHDHARQPGVEELRAHHRVRIHRAPTSAWRAGRCTTSARSTSSPPR